MIVFQPVREHLYATHDGAIWPAARAVMIDASAIRVRMTGDVRALIREQDAVSEDDLARLGWTRAQIARHGAAARDAALARQLGDASPTGEVGAELPRIATSAFASACMIAAVACLCWAAGGSGIV